MWAAQVLKLHAHNGRMLTRPEILLDQFHEKRNAEQKRLADEKLNEKMMLSRISSKMITVPSIKREQSDIPSSQDSKFDVPRQELPRPYDDDDDDNDNDNGGESNESEDDQVDGDDGLLDEPHVPRQKGSRKREKSNRLDSLEDGSTNDTESTDNADSINYGIIDKLSENVAGGDTVAPAASQRIKKKQRQSEIITVLTEQDLTALFSPAGLLLNSDWNTIKDPLMKEFKLDDFSYEKNNTLAMKLTVPPESTRWSFNICPPNHFESTNILIHFNPRKGKRRELIMNDKQGTWGTRQPEAYGSLQLTLPVLDDNGKPEHAVFHKVWWGVTDPSLPFHEIPASALALATIEMNPAGPRTVLVSGLPLLYDVQALQVLEGALLSLFEEYCPEAINVVPGDSGTAYVKLKESSYVDMFIEVFNGSTVGEDNQKQYTLELSKYDCNRS